MLIEALLRGGDNQDGIIGRFARGATRQLPSFVYWGGLGRWGIRRFDGSRQDYVASLDARQRLRRSRSAIDADETSITGIDAWHPGLPSHPDVLLETALLELTFDEALFLQGRILDRAPATYVALLARDGRSDQWGDLPWDHPLAGSAPPSVRRHLHHASLFSLAAWGAGLIYNDELSRLLEQDRSEPLDVGYADDLKVWATEMVDQGDGFANWDRRDFWRLIHEENPRMSASVRLLVDWWLDLAVGLASGRGRPGEDVVTARRIRDDLRKREAAIKGPRAKLANRRARERSPGAQGGVRLTFRWRQVSRVVGDIQRGLERDAQPA